MNWSWIYVGVLYAVAVALARRARIDLPKRIAFFFYLLVLVFFFKPLTGDYVNTQDDILKSLPPWHYMVPDKIGINMEMNDIPLQHTVWAHQVRESWKSITPPLWNSFSGSGYPLLANGQSSALSPIRILALPVPMEHFMAAEAAMKILIALIFTFLFCRGRGYSELPSVIGAITFGFAGFLHSWLHFPHVTTAVFLPAVLFFIDRLASCHAERSRGIPSRSAGDPSTVLGMTRLFVAAAVVWPCILFGGHPETASHIFFLSLLYVLWIVLIERRASWRFFLILGGAMTVAALLSAPFLAPFLEALPRSQRYNALRLMPYDPKGLPYTDFQCKVVMFQAHFYGQVPQEPRWGPSVAEPVGGFAGVLGIASFIAMVVHVVRRHAWRSPEMFFVLATILVFGVINGWPGLNQVIHAVLPVVAHARFRLLFVFLMGVQAAAAIDLTLRGDRKPLLFGLTVVTAMLVALLAITHFPDAAKRASTIEASLRSFAVLVIGALFVLMSRWRKPALLALMVAVIVELWSVTRGWNPVLPRWVMYYRTPIIDALIGLKNEAKEPFRIAGIGPMLFPNTSAMYGIEDMRAHDPMANDRYMGFLTITADYKTEFYHPMFHHAGAPVLDYMNVRYLLQDLNAPIPEEWRYKRVYEGMDGRIFENRTVLPRFFGVRNVIVEPHVQAFADKLAAHRDWANTALLESPIAVDPGPAPATQILESHPTSYRLHVRATHRSLIVSSIPSWPGWKVSAPAQPVRVNGVFLGFVVPPGQHDVHVYYRPWSWWGGVAICLLTLVALVVAYALVGRNENLVAARRVSDDT